VSYDIDVYCDQEVFPEEGLWEILVSFGYPVRREGGLAWRLDTGYSVAISVRAVAEERWKGCSAPEETQWVLVASTGASRTAEAFWHQLAVPYHMLILLPGMSIHDCQVGLHDLGLVTDPDEYRRLAFFSMRGGRYLSRLRRDEHRFDDDGLPIF
jgi:hypothetical protein